MNQRMAIDFAPAEGSRRRRSQTSINALIEQQFIERLLHAAKPQIRALIREMMAIPPSQPLVVDYEEAGRMIGTSYEGVRKLVRKGKLTAVSRSGRHRGIAIDELKEYVQRSAVTPP
jgi:excisionase family DNA binding protein